MIALKFVSVAALLTLSLGCQSSGSMSSRTGPQWAAHEAISRTFDSGCNFTASDRSLASANDDTSRTYTSCCPMILDGAKMHSFLDDTSRTYHTCCPMLLTDHRPLTADESNARAKGLCAGPVGDGICVACAKH